MAPTASSPLLLVGLDCIPLHQYNHVRACLMNERHLSAHHWRQMRSPTRYTKQLWRGQNRLDYWSDAPDRTYTLRRTLRALGITKDESRVSGSCQGWARGCWKWHGCNLCVGWHAVDTTVRGPCEQTQMNGLFAWTLASYSVTFHCLSPPAWKMYIAASHRLYLWHPLIYSFDAHDTFSARLTLSTWNTVRTGAKVSSLHTRNEERS